MEVPIDENLLIMLRKIKYNLLKLIIKCTCSYNQLYDEDFFFVVDMVSYVLIFVYLLPSRRANNSTVSDSFGFL